jgi:hypothetical protein
MNKLVSSTKYIGIKLDDSIFKKTIKTIDYQSFISNPTFIKMHFHRSSKNHHFILNQTLNYVLCSAVSLHLHRLLENTSTIVADDTCRNLKWGFCEVVGSYNRLLCVLFHGSISATQNKYCFRLWNPATRTISRELGFLIDHKLRPYDSLKFSFCRDYLTGD